MPEAQDMLAGMSHTYLSDLMQGEIYYKVLYDMCQKDEIHMYIDGMHNVNDLTREADLAKAIAERTKYDVEGLMKVDTVKYFVDGSMAMIEPYTDEYCNEEGLPHGFQEELLWNEQNLMESMEKAQAAGFNIHAHCMGDWAVKWTAECYANAKKQDKENKLHSTYVTEDTKKLMGETGTIASIQPGWFSIGTYCNPTQGKMYGFDKAKTNYPCRSLLDNGVVCAFGSDYPINEPYLLHASLCIL